MSQLKDSGIDDVLEPGGDPHSDPTHAAEVHGRGVQGLGVVVGEGAVEHQGLAHGHIGITRGDLWNTKDSSVSTCTSLVEVSRILRHGCTPWMHTMNVHHGCTP